MNDSIFIKKGVELEIEVQSLAYGGMGLAKVDDFVVFVKNGIPGQRVLVLVYKKKNRLLMHLRGLVDLLILRLTELDRLKINITIEIRWNLLFLLIGGF